MCLWHSFWNVPSSFNLNKSDVGKQRPELGSLRSRLVNLGLCFLHRFCNLGDVFYAYYYHPINAPSPFVFRFLWDSDISKVAALGEGLSLEARLLSR